MQRNKLIYALADAALVVNSDFEKGGTWTGAVEQLDRLHFVPLFVRNGDTMPKGNAALLRRGAYPWPNPQTGPALNAALTAAADLASGEPKQHSLPLMSAEGGRVEESAPVETPAIQKVAPSEKPKIETRSAASEELLETVREILRRELVVELTEDEIATLLAVTKPQAKAWMARLVKEGSLEKVKKSKPARYRTASASDRLF
jgi:predicted Rossmann fold nucleotide-binding protein DprA/Smf involved in DNA uptake